MTWMGEALFLDFDGTLVEIADRPEAVRVDPGLPALLSGMRTKLGGALAIVTGRPVGGVDTFLPGLGLDACGNHGLERRVGGRTLPIPGLREIGSEIAAIEARFASRPDVVVEDKRIGVAVHWRLAPEAEAEIRSVMGTLARDLGPGYRIQEGKAVCEIVPAAAGKGEGIRALMGMPPYAGRRAVFVGDDRTDEHGFAAVASLGGVAVKVGPGDTAAGRRLASPTAVRAWLALWLAGEPALDGLPEA